MTTAGSQVLISPRLLEQEVSELTECQKLHLMSDLFRSYCQTRLCVVPDDDFMLLSVLAMIHLKSCKRSNVLYKFAKCLGTMRGDGSDSLLPAKRIPMELIEHCMDFFSSSSSQEASTCIYDLCTGNLI